MEGKQFSLSPITAGGHPCPPRWPQLVTRPSPQQALDPVSILGSDMRIHDAKLDLTRDLWRKPALARAYLQARLRSPPRSNVVEVLTVSDELGAAVATGLPFAWAPGVAERVLKGELTCERFSRHAEVEGKDSGRRRTPSGSHSRLKFGVSADRGASSSMEDEHVLHAPPGADFAFCCVYDGHGGSHASQFCREQLHFNVMASEAFARGNAQAALLEGFRKTETDLLREQTHEHEQLLRGLRCRSERQASSVHGEGLPSVYSGAAVDPNE